MKGNDRQYFPLALKSEGSSSAAFLGEGRPACVYYEKAYDNLESRCVAFRVYP